MSRDNEFRERMLMRPLIDNVDPVDLELALSHLSFTPVELKQWKLQMASAGGEALQRQSMLTRVYQLPSSTQVLLVESDVRTVASVALPTANTSVNARPAHLVSVVNAERHGAAAIAWRSDPIMYMLRIWMDDVDSSSLIQRAHELAHEIDARQSD